MSKITDWTHTWMVDNKCDFTKALPAESLAQIENMFT